MPVDVVRGRRPILRTRRPGYDNWYEKMMADLMVLAPPIGYPLDDDREDEFIDEARNE